ncbi:1-(5-phosphoribosyl)-5-[(5-phosphoribosylamino)methylideneamino] imidazole-4-carboxamide isomerase [Coralliovum pocilloporae]|uniref:1-(5-phosphoribosyl)-5-[(5- phosphoribosylamino)methylideneamino]imidazole-4- carboxamide isomerase n=1 Tax=Coralliovum pocilloporae TaxID=3066369 RepID=UPI0033079687
MIIYPDIELQNGKCVNLLRGQMDQPVVYDVDPVEAARAFAEQGAKRLHVIDLDAVSGTGSNADIIKEIIRVGPNVQVGGGINSMEQIREWIDAGAARVVIATAAVKQPTLVKEAAHAYPDQIVVSVDVRDNKVLCAGWKETSSFSPVEFIEIFQDDPMAGFILTDVGRDMDDPVESFAMTTAVAKEVRVPIISSGLISSIDDVSMLKYLPNIAGTIVGRALFNKEFTLEEAIAIGDAVDPTAQFA